MNFEIEQIVHLRDRNQVYVLAKNLDKKYFELGDNSTLGGIAIQRWADIPRSENSMGEQRLDLFAFVLVDSSDMQKFSKKQIVKLKP